MNWFALIFNIAVFIFVIRMHVRAQKRFRQMDAELDKRLDDLRRGRG